MNRLEKIAHEYSTKHPYSLVQHGPTTWALLYDGKEVGTVPANTVDVLLIDLINAAFRAGAFSVLEKLSLFEVVKGKRALRRLYDER